MHITLAVSAFALVSFCASADDAKVVKPVTHAPKKVSLTFDPLQAGLGVAQVSIEGRASRKVGVAVDVGGGYSPVPFSGFPFSKEPKGGVGRLGISPRYYLVGDFDHGLQLGARARLSVVVPGDIVFMLSASPYVGYKYTAPIGLTVEVQGGVSFALAQGFVMGGGGTGVTPMANVNVGWSF